MQTLLTIIHIVASILLCLVILLQSGRGGGMGAAFGGASSQIFGGRGAGNFLSRLTSVAAVIFFVTSLTLSMMSSRSASVVQETKSAESVAPAATGDSHAVTPAGNNEPAAEAKPEPTTPPATPPEATPPTK